jgi:hypothetical protein
MATATARKSASPAYDIAKGREAARSLLLSMRGNADVEGDENADIRTDLIEGETDLMDAIDSGLERLATLEAMVEANGATAKRILERARRLDAQYDTIKQAILRAMADCGLKTIERPIATASIPKPRLVLDITSEHDIPTVFYDTPEPEPKLVKKRLEDALKAGETVPGAQLKEATQSLSIRFR